MNWKRLVVLPAACALAALSLGAVTGAGPAGADPTYTWNLAHDMGQDYVDNPIADSYNNPGVWSYEAIALGGETSLGTLLDQYTDQTQCNAAFHTASGGYPAVAYHYGDSTETCGTPTYPAQSVLLHPSNDGSDAAVKWTSPITGTVHLVADLTDEDANGGDGFTYEVSDDNGSNLASGSVDDGGTSGTFSYDTSVTAGSSLYVLVGAGNDYTFDTTKLDLTITGTSSATPVNLFTHVAYGAKNRAGATKVTLGVTLRAAAAGPALTGTVTADGFTCGPLRDATGRGPVAKAKAKCVGYFPPGSQSSNVHYSGDATYAPADTTVPFET